MYKDFFGFVEQPFSIVPNSRYLYLSQRHKEAITHLKAGLGEGGGFAMLTGEVGTGKTTVAKAMLVNLDESTKAGLILNPTFSTQDLLEAICDEFKIIYPQDATLKQLNQAIHHYLLKNHNAGWQTLLVIDEAQHLAADVLEQLRLLTNLETESRKLLKVLLVGQPELQRLLQTTQLRQLAQRITGRYHLLPLDEKETTDYIAFRLHTAGGDEQLFSRSSTKTIAKYSHGIPRLINLICDKALFMSYQQGKVVVDKATVSNACKEVMQFQADIYQQDRISPFKSLSWPRWGTAVVGVAAAFSIGWAAINHLPLKPLSQAIQQTVFGTSVESIAAIGQLSSEQRELLLSQKQSNFAVNELYRLWGYHSYVGDNLCMAEALSTMLCERKTVTWPMLIEQSRPVILELNDQGEVGYVTLYAVGNNQVEVLNGAQRLRLPISWLTPIWQGNIIELRQAPLKETLRIDMRGSAVEMLDQLLAEATHDAPLGQSLFDTEMKKRVERFQRMQGMGVDGIAGQRTLERLQQIVQPNAPILASVQTTSVAPELPSANVRLFEVLEYPHSTQLVQLTREWPTAELLADSGTNQRSEEPVSREADIQPRHVNDEELALSLNDIDLSSLSPALAMKVENVLSSKRNSTSSLSSQLNDLADNPQRWQGRLPALNLQTHMYASNAKRRWVKINNVEYHQGEVVEGQVTLKEIQPQAVIVEYQGEQIRIPALYEWQG